MTSDFKDLISYVTCGRLFQPVGAALRREREREIGLYVVSAFQSQLYRDKQWHRAVLYKFALIGWLILTDHTLLNWAVAGYQRQ